MLTPSNPRHSHDEQLTPEQTHYRGSTGLGVGLSLMGLGVFLLFVGGGALSAFLLILGAVFAIYGGLARATSRDRTPSDR